MPTLRRSKSLNDKISRQKNRSGDVVRDPRSPDVEGRTRTCVDNFQALVHLRKQTEDKARQLELAFNYATNGHTYLRPRGPSGGVELPYPSPTTTTPTAITPTTAKSPTRHHHHPYPHPDPALDSKSKPPAAPRRQHSAEGRASSAALRRQESLPENQASSSTSSSSTSQPHQSRRDQRRGGGARPMSMVEPLLGAGMGARGGLFPAQEELLRKEQVIQNLTENQRGLNAHNQKLLAKVDELEFENHRLRDLLNAQHVQQQFGGTYSPTQPQFPAHGCGGGGGSAGSRPHRSISLHGDALKVSAPPPPSGHALVSPHSETSVSGYGSLADSPSGEGFVAGSPEARGVGPPAARTVGAGEVEVEDDDTLPLSGVSECSLEYRQDTLEKTSTSSSSARTSSSSRASRAATLNSDRSDLDLTSGGGRRSKTQGSAEGEGEPEGEGGCNPRIEELAKQVAELSSQRDTVILRYKLLLDDNFRVLKRDKRIQEELGTLIDRHVKDLQEDLRSELQIVQEQLKDLNEDVQVEVQRALSALDTSSPGPGSKESVTPTMSSDDRGMLDRLVDLIGPDYRRLGRRLTVPQPELDSVEKDPQLSTCAHKTQAVLKTWLQRRGGAGPADGGGGEEGSVEVPPAVRHLVQALRDVDKDLQHCQQSTVSGPERQALRNCLQLAIDHVMDPRDVLDHLIALNELSPAGIAFVQEVLEKRERAVCRLWHVAEYRGTGMVSRLALALDRSHCAQLAHRLRDELEIQNSRIHTQYRPSGDDPPPASTPPPPVSAPVATPPLESCASASQARSRPMSRVPRLRSKTFDSVSHPVKASPTVEVPAVSAARKDKSKPLRPVSMAGPEKEAVPPQERPKSAVLKERVAPVVPEEKTAPGSKNNGRQTNQQQERRGLPVPRDRSFSPFHKNKPTPSQPREKPAADTAKERPLSPLAKDVDNKPDSAARNRPFSPFDRSSRPFSPFEKDRASRQFSPFEKDKPRRAFSPEGNKAARSNSPLDRQRLAAAAAQHGKSGGLQTQRDRPFSPLQKSKPATSFQKERIANSTQRERANNALAQSEKPAPPPVDESPTAQPSRDVLAVWDKRAAAGSKLGAPPAYGARNTVVLEQGGKISRV